LLSLLLLHFTSIFVILIFFIYFYAFIFKRQQLAHFSDTRVDVNYVWHYINRHIIVLQLDNKSWRGGSMVGRRIRDWKVIGRSRVRPPVYALPGNNLGQVVYMHVPLSTKQYKLVPASAGT